MKNDDKKTICPDCGREFERKSKTQIRCRECQTKRRNKEDAKKRAEKGREKNQVHKDYYCQRKDCRFITREQGLNICNYLLIAGERRGCPAESCNKYERGKQK